MSATIHILSSVPKEKRCPIILNILRHNNRWTGTHATINECLDMCDEKVEYIRNLLKGSYRE